VRLRVKVSDEEGQQQQVGVRLTVRLTVRLKEDEEVRLRDEVGLGKESDEVEVLA
jgi:hypothetical protein